ncbi:DUF350 domain-containing protein [bacterium]|nr:DUF350 domain-containing protein [bacterium]
MDLQTEITWLGISFGYIAVGFALVLLSKFLKDLLTPYRLDVELSHKDNVALGLAITGYFAGVLIIFLGAAVGPSPDEVPQLSVLGMELAQTLLYAVVGIVMLNFSSFLIDKMVLYKFSMRKEIIEDRNVGTGAVEAGCLVANGLVIAGAIHGDGDFATAVVFYLLGQVVLILFGLFYQWITSYDIHHEIEEDNVAAGVSLGFGMAAIGIILLKSTFGDFISWEHNLAMFGIYAGTGFVTLMIVRKIVDVAILPRTTLHHEIVEDRNLNAALLEGTLSVGGAAAILLIF